MALIACAASRIARIEITIMSLLRLVGRYGRIRRGIVGHSAVNLRGGAAENWPLLKSIPFPW